MDFYLLNSNFEKVKIIESYESFIWTRRLYECGDFELYTNVDTDILNNITLGKSYIMSDTFNYKRNDYNYMMLMIVETIELTYEFESGPKLKITGRDLKSILDRRIVWGIKHYDAAMEIYAFTYSLLNSEFTDPSNWEKEYISGLDDVIKIKVKSSDRKMSNLKLCNQIMSDMTSRKMVYQRNRYNVDLRIRNTKPDDIDNWNILLNKMDSIGAESMYKLMTYFYQWIMSDTDYNNIMKKFIDYNNESIYSLLSITDTTDQYYIPIPDSIRENLLKDLLKEDKQYSGDNVYEILVELCQTYKFGLDVLYNKDLGVFEVFIIKQNDRTRDSNTNNVLIFSSELNNMKDPSYIESTSIYKNAVLIGGEGDEYNIMYNVVTSSDDIDPFYRRELYLDASSVSYEDDTSHNITDNAGYLSILKGMGEVELTKNDISKVYDCSAEDDIIYTYPKDYDVGDIAEFKINLFGEYNKSLKMLITEVILNIGSDGYYINPSFESLEKTEEE